jgi:predicted Zn-dependent protease
MAEAEATLKSLVAQAEELAALSPEDREYMPLLGPQEYVAVNGYDAETADLPAASRAKAVSEAIETAKKQKVIAAGLFENVASTSVLANSAGLFGFYPSSMATFSVTARSSDEKGSGYTAISSHKFASLDLKETTAIAAKKAMDSRNGRELKPGAYTSILEPQAVADLISRLDFDARLADEGRSVFTASGGQTRLGEKIFDSRVNIYADPQHPVIPSSPLGPAGYPVAKADLVREGVLKNLSYSRFWAAKNKKQPGPYQTNLIIDGENTPLSKIIASTERGILVTRLWYIRVVDPQQALHTGLTRDGTFWIEDGEIKYPIKNFRFNESPYRILGEVEALGTAQPSVSGERYGDFRMLLPAIKVKSFRFTSISDAV